MYSISEDIRYQQRYGPWAVVTGASSGIGACFARQLAAKGLNIITVARRGDLLRSVNKELEVEYEVETLAIEADLSTEEGVETLFEQTQGYDVGLVINNAGKSYIGPFEKEEHIRKLINLNVTAVTQISNIFLRRAKVEYQRDTFGLIMLSSVSSLGCPYLSVYSSTKCYVSCLAETLAAEYNSQYDIMSLEPGYVKSEMTLGRGEKLEMEYPLILEKDRCVSLCLSNFGYGKRVYTPGFLNRCFKYFLLSFPRSWVHTFLHHVFTSISLSRDHNRRVLSNDRRFLSNLFSYGSTYTLSGIFKSKPV